MKRRLTFREHVLLASGLPIIVCFAVYWHLHLEAGWQPLPAIGLAVLVQLALGIIVNTIVERRLRP